MTTAFFSSIYLKKNSIVDVFWGLGFVLIALLNLLKFSEFSTKQIFVSMLILIWGLRLSIYLLRRNLYLPEDFRYIEITKNWGNNFYLFSFFQIYLLQGLLIFIIAFPIIFINSGTNNHFSFFDIFAFALWLFGFYFETAGDYQLKKFKQKTSNSGKILKTGVWRKTRHPNYFGEFCMTWGIYFFALTSGHYWCIFSPLLMSFLLLRVSGTPMLEKRFSGNAEYEAYAKSTPVFFPKLFKK